MIRFFSFILLLFFFPLLSETRKSSTRIIWKEKKRVALLVGINNYNDASDLKYAVSDSKRMAELLAQIGYKKEDIIVVNDLEGRSDPTKLPTKANIESWVKKLTLTPELDTFLFYFSGHGFMSEGKNSLAFQDTKIIYSGNEVSRHENSFELSELVKIGLNSNKNTNQLLLIDACRSPIPKKETKVKTKIAAKSGEKDSTVPDAKKTQDSQKKEISAESTKEESPKPEIFLLDRGSNEFILSSSEESIPESLLQFNPGVYALIGTAPNRYSLEDNDFKGGVFTHYLLKGLSGGVLNNVPEEYVTYGALKEYIEQGFKDYNDDKKEIIQILFQNIAGVGTGNQTEKYVISLGRADGNKIFRLKYKDSENKPAYAKLILNKKGKRDSIQFYKQSSPENPPVGDDLHGIWKIKYNYLDGEKYFQADEYNLEKNLTNSYIIEYDDKKGWFYESIYRPDLSFGEQRKKRLSPSREEKKKIRFQKLVFDFNGNNTSAEYFEEPNFNKTTQRLEKRRVLLDGQIAILKNAFDYNSEITLEEYYNELGELVANQEGIARYVAGYRDKMSPVMEETYNSEGGLNDNKSGFARTSYKYNPDGNLTQKQYFNSLFQPTENEEGIHTYEYQYHISKNLEKEIHKDKTGNLRSDSDDIAQKNFQYDEKGNLISEEYYRSDERPWHLGGKSKVLYSYDDKNRVKTVNYFSEHLDKEGNRIPGTDDIGVHKYELKYSEGCYAKKLETVQEKETKNPSRPKVKRFRFDRDSMPDCISSFRIFGTKLEPITDRNKCHKTEIRYFSYQYDTEEIRYCEDKSGEIVWFSNPEFTDGSFNDFDEKYNEIMTEIILNKKKGDPETGIFRTYFVYNENGSEILKYYTDANEKLKADSDGFAKYENQFDENGFLSLSAYFDENGKPKANAEGIARYEYKYNANGNEIYSATFDENGKLKGNSDGIAKTITEYDTKEHVISISYYGEDDKLIAGSDGIARTEYQYDEKGNEVSLKFFGADENPVSDKEGIAHYERLFDENGKIISEEFFGPDGKLKANAKGIAKTTNKYDENGRQLSESLFGEDGKPHETKFGIATFTFEYDEMDRITGRFFYSANGKLKHQTKSEFSPDGRLLSIINMDEKKKPNPGSYGIHKYNFIYDKNGKLLTEEYFDVNGKLFGPKNDFSYPNNKTNAQRKANIARYKYEYDENGKLILEATYGEDGKLIANPEFYNGIAKRIYKYKDDKLVLKAFFGPDDKPNAGSSVARYEYEYNEQGKKTLEAYYGSDGNLVGRDIAKYVYAYDKNGNMTLESYYGKDGKLKEQWNGIAKKEWKYDDNGRKLSESFFGAEGELKKYDGRAKTIFEYNSQGKVISERNYGVNGKLMENGTAQKFYTYDHLGNIIEENHLNHLGNPVGEISKYIYKFDERSNRIFEAYFGQDDQLMMNGDSAKKERLYNQECLNLVVLEFGDKTKLNYEKLSQYNIRVESCKLYEASFNEKNVVIELKLFEEGKEISTYTLDEDGYVKKEEKTNLLFFKNERGASDKRIVKATMDWVYRPLKLEFVSD